MSSSISSSDTRAYRRFAGALVTLVLLPGALLFGWAIRLGPVDGDLTRVGAFSEQDHGWNGVQHIHSRVLYQTGAYDRPFDVVVLGDSLSVAMPQHQWQNALVEATGLSVLTRNIYDTRLDTLLASPAYRDHPPAYVVLQIVERQLPELLAQQATCDPAAASQPRPPVVALPDRPTGPPASRVPLERVKTWSGWQDVRAEFAAKHLAYGLLRRWTDFQPGKARALALQRDDLLSSTRADTLLVFRADIDKTAQWDRVTLDGLACLAHGARAKVERNGRTRFVLMVAPDKLTAYAAQLRDEVLRGASRLPALAERLPDLVPRLDLALQQAVATGTRDVYLPNNTHWGIAGHDVTARALLDFLRRPAPAVSATSPAGAPPAATPAGTGAAPAPAAR